MYYSSNPQIGSDRGGQMSEEEFQAADFLPINDILARFPVIGQTIFDYLDDQSLKQGTVIPIG